MAIRRILSFTNSQTFIFDQMTILLSNKPLSILYHHRTQGRGAEGVHISSIVNSLTAMGHEVTILSPPGIDPLSNAGNAPVDKSNVDTKGINSLWKVISKNLPNFIFEAIEIAYNIPACWRLYRKMSSKKYDLVYERYAFYMIAGAFISSRFAIPFVLEANEVSGIKDRARKQTFPWLCRQFERYLFCRCAAIHTVSSYLKNMIVGRGVEINLVKVVPNAIDPQKFAVVVDSSKIRRSLNIEDSIVIGFAGWFDDWDRLDLLVDVFNNLLKRHHNIRLMLIGDGAVLDMVRDKAKEYSIEDSIILTGAVERNEIQRYLSVLDIAVITHSNEFGSPVVMFEFMGLKIPIIAPNLLPITDVLVHGETALIFETLNMEQFSMYLEKLIADSNSRDLLANNAYELLLSEHTWDQNAMHILEATSITGL